MKTRRRSRDVALVAVPVLAAAFAGCGSRDETAYCVDQSDRIVENRYCDNPSPSYFWYYGGAAAVAGRALRPGTRLAGGTAVASTNVSENIERGGFGSNAGGRGGVGRSVAHAGGGG